jgi:dTDP-4-dehydrorhamnose reductase
MMGAAAGGRRILLTGCTGQVGWELQRSLAPLGEVLSAGVNTQPYAVDFAHPETIRSLIREARPAVIVNAAAYTAVDKAEKEPDLAHLINGVAPGILAEEAGRLQALLVHYSTDYVFDGRKAALYTEDDEPNPLNVYGRSKLAGEQAIQRAGGRYLILRTSWVYGMRGRNFLSTILRLAHERQELNIVDDQLGAPTWSRHIAESTAQILAQYFSPLILDASSLASCSGIYHLTAGGYTSWYGFAKTVLERAAGIDAGNRAYMFLDSRLKAITTQQYPTPAQRPLDSRLDTTRLERIFGLVSPRWEIMLRLCMESGWNSMMVPPSI